MQLFCENYVLNICCMSKSNKKLMGFNYLNRGMVLIFFKCFNFFKFFQKTPRDIKLKLIM